MPQIGANFIYKSYKPNFERDSMLWEQMLNVEATDIDVGHIVYCRPPTEKEIEDSIGLIVEITQHPDQNGKHFIYKDSRRGDSWDDRWELIGGKEELVFWPITLNGYQLNPDDYEEAPYNEIRPLGITSTLGEHTWNELKAISNNNLLLVLVVHFANTPNGETNKIFMPCSLQDLGAIINISSRHLIDLDSGGMELYLTCLQNRLSGDLDSWTILANGKIYYYKDTISSNYINNLN